LGIRADGGKEILGLWLEQNEGAKFWLRVMNELRGRGVEDLLLAVVDGPKGFPEAILAVFPEAQVQTCIVHLLRQSLVFVPYKDRKAVAAALKAIYQAVDAAAAEAALTAFEAGAWGQKYPAIGQSWRRAWGEVVPFYAFSVDIRRFLYTTNVIEALNSKLRRAVRARGHFPTDEAALKLLFLVLHQAEGVDHAAAGMVHGQGPVRRAVRRALHPRHGLSVFNRPAAHEIPDSPHLAQHIATRPAGAAFDGQMLDIPPSQVLRQRATATGLRLLLRRQTTRCLVLRVTAAACRGNVGQHLVLSSGHRACP
jgi:hypothetical protein